MPNVNILPPQFQQAYEQDPQTQLALAMIQKGSSTEPIRSPWQGYAQLANALAGMYSNYKQRQRYGAAADQYNQAQQALVKAMMGGQSPQQLLSDPSMQNNPYVTQAVMPLAEAGYKANLDVQKAARIKQAEQPFEKPMERSNNQERWLVTQSGQEVPGSRVKLQATPGELLTAENAKKAREMEQARLDEEKRFHNMMHLGDPQAIASRAQGIATYQLPPLSPREMQTQEGQQTLMQVLAINKDYQATNFPQFQKIANSYGAGQDHKITEAFNTAIDHVHTMLPLIHAMSNGDIPAFNAARNWYQKNTGQTAPTDFSSVKQLVAGELVKAATGSAGALGDREEMERNFGQNMSPQQLESNVNNYLHLMGGKMLAHRQGYEGPTGWKDFDKYLTPSAKQFMDQYSGASAAPQQGAVPQSYANDPLAAILNKHGALGQ